MLNHLRESVGLDLWMVTRTEGADWIILEATENAYGVSPGAAFPWQDTFCSRMVEGAPRVAPHAAGVAEYAAAPIGQRLDIGSYVGIPITDGRGELFGTLCAIDPQPQSDALPERADEVTLLAQLLSTILRGELAAEAAQRELEVAESNATTDVLTGLANRRGWDEFVAREEARCRRFGHPAAVLIIDLDGLKLVNDGRGHAAGDALLRSAGDALRESVRGSDLAARLGGDEFGILATESGATAAAVLRERVTRRLEQARVPASVGTALRPPDGTIHDAVAEADAAMYRMKAARR